MAYFLPTKIVFGEKTFLKIFYELKERKVKKPLLVCGKHFTSTMHFKELKKNLKGMEVFSRIEANPSTASVDKAAEMMNEKSCDAVIGIGGGSVLDAAKVVACMKNFSGSCESLYEKIRVKEKVPFFALPTTSGSGSEATKYSVLTRSSGMKETLKDDLFYPEAAIVDPELTYSMPASVTAATGIDAFCQAVEAYWAATSMPETDEFAEAAIKLSFKTLRKVVNAPDKSSRHDMALASLTTARAFSNTGTTACHTLSYAFTKYYGLVHGFAVALTIPSFLEFYSESTEKCLAICGFFGVNTIGEGKQKILGLMREVGAPTRLREIGCKKKDLQKIIELSLADKLGNPRNHSAEDLEKIFEKIF